MELVPIKIRIGLNDKGQCKYPDFNQIDASIRQNMDWSKYIDLHGTGWCYNKMCGHTDEEDGDDYGCCRGEWCGVVAVPEDFALAAISLFPNDVKNINETEFETFWNEKGRIHLSDDTIDEAVLKSFEVKHKALGVDPLTDDAYLKAINRDDPTPGITKNHDRYWSDYKNKKRITLKSRIRP